MSGGRTRRERRGGVWGGVDREVFHPHHRAAVRHRGGGVHRGDDDEEVEHVRAPRAEEVFCRPRHGRGGLRRVLDGREDDALGAERLQGCGRALGAAGAVHENRGLVRHARGEGGSEGGLSRRPRRGSWRDTDTPVAEKG